MLRQEGGSNPASLRILRVRGDPMEPELRDVDLAVRVAVFDGRVFVEADSDRQVGDGDLGCRILANGCRARTLESAREALGSIGCPDDGGVDDDAPEGEREGDEIPQPETAPVACPHCGAAMRLVRDIPRRRPAHASRAPPSDQPNHGAQP